MSEASISVSYHSFFQHHISPHSIWSPAFFLKVLQTLCEQSHDTWDPEKTKQILEQVGIGKEESGFDFLQKTGEALHLQMTAMECSLRELSHGTESVFPLLLISPSQLWVLQKQKHGKIFAYEVVEHQEKGWFSRKKLAKRLGVSENDSLSFVVSMSTQTSIPPFDEHTKEQKSHFSPIKRLGQLLRLERKDVGAVSLYAICIGLFSLTIPVGVQALVNTVARGVLLQPVLILTFLVFLGLILSGLFRAFQIYLVEVLQQRLFVRTALELSHRLIQLQPRVYEQTYIPEQVNRFFDIVTLQKSLSGLLLEGLSVILQMGIGLLVLAFYHPILLAFDVFLVFLILVLLFGLGRKAIPTSVSESEAKYKVAAWLEELGRYKSVFRSSSGKQKALDQLHFLTSNYLYKRKSHFRILFRQIVGSLWIQAVMSAVLLGIGGALVIRGQLTLGQLFSAELIVSGILASVAKLDKHLENFYDLNAALDKLGHLMELPIESSLGSKPHSLHKGVSVRVKNSFEKLGESILWKQLSIHITAGSKVALLSRNPNSLQRFAELLWCERVPEKGRGFFEVDGLALSLWKLEALRSRILWLNKPEIFSGTLLENVQLGNHAISLDTIYDALKEVGLYEEIVSLPEGIHTKLQPEAPSLSAIQRRQLLVARALVQKPGLLLISEPFFAPLSSQEPWLYHLFRILLHSSAPWTVVVLTTPSFAKRLELLLSREELFSQLSLDMEESHVDF